MDYTIKRCSSISHVYFISLQDYEIGIKQVCKMVGKKKVGGWMGRWVSGWMCGYVGGQGMYRWVSM